MTETVLGASLLTGLSGFMWWFSTVLVNEEPEDYKTTMGAFFIWYFRITSVLVGVMAVDVWWVVLS